MHVTGNKNTNAKVTKYLYEEPIRTIQRMTQVSVAQKTKVVKCGKALSETTLTAS